MTSSLGSKRQLKGRRHQHHRWTNIAIKRKMWICRLAVILGLTATFILRPVTRMIQDLEAKRPGTTSNSSIPITPRNSTISNFQLPRIDGLKSSSSMGSFESHLDSTTQQMTDCPRASGTRIGNKIVYGSIQAAGLLDRRELLRGLLTMAQNLRGNTECVTDGDINGGVSVVVPKPSILLSTLHNQDKSVSSQMTWSDLFVFTTNIEDQIDSSVLDSSYKNSDDKIHRQSLMLQDIQQVYPSSIISSGGRNRQVIFRHDMIATQEKHKLQHQQRQEDVNILVTTRPQEAVEHYLTIRNWTVASTEQKHRNWIWIWTLPYNSMRQELSTEFPSLLPLPPKLREQPKDSTNRSNESRYGSSPPPLVVSEAPPDYIKELVDTIWNKNILAGLSPNRISSNDQQEANSVVGYLHIRRGDSISRCDTSLPRMESYLSCSLAQFVGVRRQVNADHTGSSSISSLSNQEERTKTLILLFSTDETDPSYRRGIRQIVKQTIGDSNHQQFQFDSGNIGGYSIHLIDLDELIHHVLYQRVVIEKSGPKWWLDNNYLIFRIQMELQQHPYSSFLLEQRQRYHCNDCDFISLSSLR